MKPESQHSDEGLRRHYHKTSVEKPKELVIIEAAVFILVAQAVVINRLAGLDYPIWKSHETAQIGSP
jgi:hypothetical protein